MAEETIKEILKIEEGMFTSVKNIGGRASCQDDLETFRIMRSSHFANWSKEALESYLQDLHEAKEKGRNLLSEKYARMMELTAPLEYARIKDLLPPLAPETPSLIDKIVEIELAWQEELRKRYPHVVERGRPLYSSEDTPFFTSLETYLRGELATYSPRTLALYHQNCLEQKEKKINGAEIVLAHTVKQYGYQSLEEANHLLER